MLKELFLSARCRTALIARVQRRLSRYRLPKGPINYQNTEMSHAFNPVLALFTLRHSRQIILNRENVFKSSNNLSEQMITFKIKQVKKFLSPNTSSVPETAVSLFPRFFLAFALLFIDSRFSRICGKFVAQNRIKRGYTAQTGNRA